MVRLPLVLVLLTAACDLGTVAGPGGTNPTPGVDAGGVTPSNTGIQTFTASVYPILESKCSGCHTTSPNPNFCSDTATSSYTLITTLPAVVGTFDPTTAPVLTTIAAGHNGVTYAPTDISTITGWLNQEKAARP